MKQLSLIVLLGSVFIVDSVSGKAPATPATVLAAVQAPSASSPTFPKPSEWPTFRRDGNLQAHSPLKGKITNPKIVWKQFIGSLESLVVVEPGDTQTRLNLPDDETAGSNDVNQVPIEDFIPNLPVEDRNICANDANTAYADILPEYPGKEKIEFESAFRKAMVNGQWPACIGRCYGKKDGEWTLVWESEPIPELFIALPLVGDFDNDGAHEIAILPFYDLLLLDARTGQLKDRCRFTDNRSYGFAGVYDFDHDGNSEFLIAADFSKHLDVLGFKDGKLSLFWTQNVEEDTFRPRREMRVAPDPAADVDGDGQAEVIASIFGDTPEKKWHLRFLNPLTGEVKFDFPDEKFSAAIDVDGDGVPEVLSTETRGVNSQPSVRVRSIKGGTANVLWSKAGVNWEIHEPNLPPHVRSSAILGQQTVLSRTAGKKLQVVLRDAYSPSQASVSIAEWDGTQFKPLTTVRGEHLNGLGFDSAGRLLVRSRHQPGKPASLAITGGKPLQQSTKRIGVEPSPAVAVWPDGANAATIVVQDSVDEQVIFQPPTTQRTETQLQTLRIPGRGQGGWYPKTLGPVLADLRGDGSRQTIVSEIGTDGCARLAVKTLDGETVWQREFPRIPGIHNYYNVGGIVLWQTGHFRDKRKQDVLVTVQRTMLGTEETSLLSGEDGSEIWMRDKQISKRAVGGNSFAVADYDGDGLDDVASLWPSIFYTLKGTTGEDLIAMDTRWKQVYEKEVYFGQAVAGDFLSEGKSSLFFSGRLMTGVIKTDGALVWFDALDKSAPHLPSFGDFDGDNKIEMIGVGFDDGIRCYDLGSGKINWRMASPLDGKGFGMHSENPVSGAIAADIDDDGRDEALISMDNALYCLATSSNELAGEVDWKVEFPTQIGPPTVAQVEQDASASILVVGSDGYVYCVR